MSGAALLVDGMNIIGSRPDGWWRDRDGAMRRLVARLAGLAAATGEDIRVVFDGRPLPGLPEGARDGVLVLYACRPGRHGADDRIVDEVAADVEPGRLIVVTSDADLRRRARALGARVSGATALLDRLDETLPPGRRT